MNLIGEHTDYNDGYVLPMAIGRAAVVVFRRRADRVLRGHSVAYDETSERDSTASPLPADRAGSPTSPAWPGLSPPRGSTFPGSTW